MRFQSDNRQRTAILALRTAFFMALVPAMLSAQISIFRPKIGVPAFPLTNGTFDVEIESAPGLATNNWSALLVNDLRSWTCSVERVDYGSYVNCNSTTGYLLTVRTPADIAPEVFELVVNHASGGAATNRHSVKILPNYETNFYILHYADPQVETENATAANGAGGSHGSVQAIYWAAHAYSLINPRFMFNTGDELENGATGLYPKYLDAINTLGAPLLITRGNNDAQGNFSDWKRDIGQPTYSITMGSFYVCMKDYGTNENLAWFTNNYAGAFTNADISFRLFGQHYTNGGFIYTPTAGQYPDLMLVGDNHIFATLSTNPYYVLSSGPGWDYGAVAIFEFLKSGDGWICSNKTIHGTSNKLQVYGDWGQPCCVTNTFLYGNNGAVFTNTTFITNGLNYDFWDGRVRFLMRKAAFGYTVSGGEIISEYDYTSTNMAVLVKVNIRKNTLTTVTVSPLSDQSLTAPTNVTASDGCYADKVALTWSAVTNATGYQVWRHTANESASAININHVSQTSYDDAGAIPGIRYYYWLQATNDAGASGLSASDLGWRRSAAVTDYAHCDIDGDGLADPLVYNQATRTWKMLFSGSGYAPLAQEFGNPDCWPVPGDYDGDGLTDIAIYQEATGTWSILLSGSGYTLVQVQLGGTGQQPAQGDYDADGLTDLAVYQIATAGWRLYLSASGYAVVPFIFGESLCRPVQGDYDGDGYTDPALYQTTMGTWRILLSASGYGEVSASLGGSGAVPVQGDYDGDGLTDPAVYREATGEWLIILSAAGYDPVSITCGGPGYWPLVDDFDGDGQVDPAVYQEATGTWRAIFSGSGYAPASWVFGGPSYFPAGIVRP